MSQVTYFRSITAPSSKVYLRSVTAPFAYISGVNGGSANVIRKGASFTVNGTGFGASQGTGILQVLGLTGYITCSITSWNDTAIVATAPSSGIMFTPTTSVKVTPQVLGANTLTGVLYRPPSGYIFERITAVPVPSYSMASGITGLAIGDEVYLNSSTTRVGGSETATVAFNGNGDGTINLSGISVDGDYAITGINVRDLTDGNDTSNGPASITIDTTIPSGFGFTITQSSIDASNQTATGITFSSAETTTTYSIVVTSSGGGSFVNKTGTISSSSQVITGIDVSSLPDGTLTYTVTLTDTVGNTSLPVAHTVIKNNLVGAVPNQFTFVDATNASISSIVASAPVTITGLSVASAVSIVGGEYRINGGSWISSNSTILNNQQIEVRGISSSQFSTTINVVLTIGGISDTFSITTAAADITPVQFTFIDRTNIAVNSTNVTSNTITVSGINTSAIISIVGGEYSVNGQTYRSDSTQVVNGDLVTVRGNSASTSATTTNVVLTIGTISDTFSITTVSVNVSVNLFNTIAGVNTAIASTAIDWFITQTWGGPIINSGTTSTNASGVLSLTGLSALAGAGWLYVKLNSNSNFASAYPVTFI